MSEGPSPPGERSRLRPVVYLVVLAVVMYVWISYYWGRRQSPPPPPPAATAPEEATPVFLAFTIATISRESAQRPEVDRLIQAIGSAPGAQAGEDGFRSWHDQLAALAQAGLADIRSSPALTVASGQQATLGVASSGGGSASEIKITVSPRATDAGAIAIDLAVTSERADGAIELWARDAGLSLGPRAEIERSTLVAPGGGAGLVASLRAAVMPEGWLVVLVKPRVVEEPPALSAPATGGP